ncbi:hypothetical protein ACJMK2_024771 [Sinanodonta woodiana]|uniref:Uncharacterized protein n=1 Tax=Sinanodonta woodiana TaxID=1069815 RepID=A0ABD3XEE0_SINWO
MGSRIRSWYKYCEKSRKCAKCSQIGNGPWDCKEKQQQKGKSYADAASGNLESSKIDTPMEKTPDPMEKWMDILTPNKTGDKTPKGLYRISRLMMKNQGI